MTAPSSRRSLKLGANSSRTASKPGATYPCTMGAAEYPPPSITSQVVDPARGGGMFAGMTSVDAAPGVGPLLRDWRLRRRLSQLDLALEAGVSARHVSFVETGRSRPSAEMVLQLADHLDVPLRERNQMLLAAGYAPRYGEHSLDDP